jgi:hypothetical protein
VTIPAGTEWTRVIGVQNISSQPSGSR